MFRLLKPETADAAMAAAAALPAVSPGGFRKASDALLSGDHKEPAGDSYEGDGLCRADEPANPMVVAWGARTKFDKFDSAARSARRARRLTGIVFGGISGCGGRSTHPSVKANSSELVSAGRRWPS